MREKAKACTSPEELLALAKQEGNKLSDAEMEAVYEAAPEHPVYEGVAFLQAAESFSRY